MAAADAPKKIATSVSTPQPKYIAESDKNASPAPTRSTTLDYNAGTLKLLSSANDIV